VRRDVYVCRHIDDDEYTAAVVGGLLDCVTALARWGLPVGDSADEALRQAVSTCLSPQEALAVIWEAVPLRLSADATARVIAASPQRVQAELLALGLPDEVRDALGALASGRRIRR